MKHAYRPQKMKPSCLDEQPRSVLDAYYRRPLFDADQFHKRANARPVTREHLKKGYQFLSSSSRLDPSSSNYSRFKHSIRHYQPPTSSYDNPIDFDYQQDEVNEYKRQRFRAQSQHRTRIMVEEELAKKKAEAKALAAAAGET